MFSLVSRTSEKHILVRHREAQGLSCSMQLPATSCALEQQKLSATDGRSPVFPVSVRMLVTSSHHVEEACRYLQWPVHEA